MGRGSWLASVLVLSLTPACSDPSTSTGGTGGADGTASETDDTGAPPSACAPSQPDAPAVSEAEMASSMAAIFCQAQVDCDCPDRSHDTVPSCRHAMVMDFEHVRDDAQAMGLQYDGECLGQLEAAVTAIGCDLVAADGELAEVLGPGRCAVYHGDHGAGEDCMALSNYASNCAQGLACWDGTCVEACGTDAGSRTNPYGYACGPGERMSSFGGRCDVPAPTGQPCSPTGCEPGAYCHVVTIVEDVIETCESVVALDDPCETDAACGDAGLCEGSQCVAAPAEGEACLSDRCGRDHLCDGGTCVPLPSVCFLRPPPR
jgi:hypothetical protein